METPTHRLMLEATDETRFTVRVGALKTWCAWRAKAVDPSSLRSALQQRRLGCQPLAGALRAVRHAWKTPRASMPPFSNGSGML